MVLNQFVGLISHVRFRSNLSLMFSAQVDSGYNTYSVCTNSLMDALSSDSQSKEMLDTHTAEEGVPFTRHTKPKVMSLTLAPKKHQSLFNQLSHSNTLLF